MFILFTLIYLLAELVCHVQYMYVPFVKTICYIALNCCAYVLFCSCTCMYCVFSSFLEVLLVDCINLVILLCLQLLL